MGKRSFETPNNCSFAAALDENRVEIKAAIARIPELEISVEILRVRIRQLAPANRKRELVLEWDEEAQELIKSGSLERTEDSIYETPTATRKTSLSLEIESPEDPPDDASKGVSEGIPGIVPDVAPEIVPEVVPEVVSVLSPSREAETPEVAPEVTPDVVPEVVPDLSPSQEAETPEVVPEVAPEVVPDLSPSCEAKTLKAFPEVVPEVVPDSSPSREAETPKVVPQAVPVMDLTLRSSEEEEEDKEETCVFHPLDPEEKAELRER
jgi:hypothetical protein